MHISYTLAVIITVIAMMCMAQKAKKNKNETTRALIRVTHCVTLTVIASLVAMIFPNEKVANFMQTLHYASIEWVLIFFLAFLEKYTDVVKTTVKSRMIVFVGSGILSMSLLLNSIFGHVVYCVNETTRGVSFRIFKHVAPWYYIHMVFSLFLCLLCLLILIHAAVNSIAFYRVKYVPAIWAFSFTIILELVCDIRHARMNYALFGYIWMGIFLLYFTLYHTNKGLISQTLSFVTSKAYSGVLCFDIEGKCIYANDIMWKMYPEFTKLEDFKEPFKDYIGEYSLSYSNGRVWYHEHIINNEIRHYEITFAKINDEREDWIGSCFYIYDRTQSVDELESANYQATHDGLTGLYNADAFYQLVSEKKAEDKKPSLLLAADIKDFKLINDLYGFSKGNAILCKLAKCLKEGITDECIACRLNSDRFAIYLPKEDFSEDKIRDYIKPVYSLVDEFNYKINLHFGVYFVRPEDDDPTVMYDRARVALSLIKNDYTKMFSYYDDNMMQKKLREKELVGEIDKAIEEGQFKMFLQPQITPEGKMIGAEALVRWMHPIQGMISPGEFIPTFEKSGFIHKLDKYMWELAAKQIKKWQDMGLKDYYISVNISPTDFYYMDVYQTVVDIVEKYAIPPVNLKLEITESAFMNDPENQLSLIAKLQNYGFQVEIDDFGSGYSSLNMLKDLKADVLKIDMGFLRKSSENDRAMMIVDAVIKMAQNLKMLVVTEGVETIEQVEFLTKAGCDIFQGYYFDRPIPVDEFETKYLEHRFIKY